MVSEQHGPVLSPGRSRGAIISQYYNKTMKLRRDRQSRPAVRDFSRSARPSIRCHGMEADTPDSWDMEETKRERLVNNLQNLSVGDRERMIRGMPLSLKEKGDLRKLALQKDKHTHSSSKLHCCSQQKYYIIIALRHSWYSCLSFLHSLHLWQMPLKRVSSRFGTGVLSYFLFLKTLFLFNIFLVLITGVFLVIPQALHPPTPPANWSSFSGLELLTGAGYFSDSLMYYGYYSNYTLHRNGSSSSRLDLSYNMPLAYFFTIGMAFFITSLLLFVCRFFSDKVLKKRRRPGFDIAKNVLDLIYGQTLAWLGVLFTPLLPAMQILKLLLLFYIKMSSVMMNCQAPRRPYRVTQMTTIFISLLCFPSFIGAAVCVTYTMWSTKPSVSCGPFRGLNKMIQAGKIWMKQLEEENPNLSVLARAYAYLVENPLFLFMGAGIFLIVIYFHSEVVDGERKIINILQEQIENEGEDKKFLITELQSVHEQKRISRKRVAHQVSL
uniref:Transmembrane channel-like protein n=1 Tax=Nothobranchius furzeri TaxID=105023 RepID=A0A8C6KBS8_NOTFU